MTFLSGLKAKLRLDGWHVMRRAPTDLDIINEPGDSSGTLPHAGCPFGQVQCENLFSISRNEAKKSTCKKLRAATSQRDLN